MKSIMLTRTQIPTIICILILLCMTTQTQSPETNPLIFKANMVCMRSETKVRMKKKNEKKKKKFSTDLVINSKPRSSLTLCRT